MMGDVVSSAVLDPLRELSAAYLQMACGGVSGVTERDPVYRAVTEGRDPGPVYSSCGDLAHWLLYRLGVRLPWVNRAEHQGWRSGRNITDLWKGPWRKPTPEEEPRPGDIWVVWAKQDGTDAHVLCPTRIFEGQNGPALVSYEYGQAAIARDRWRPGSIEGVMKHTPLRLDGARILVGIRPLQRVLALEDVVRSAMLAEAMTHPQDPGEWLRSTEAPTGGTAA